MNAQIVHAILIMTRYAVHCEILTRGRRLLDHLNDTETDFVDAENGRFFQRQEREPILQDGPLLIAKAGIHMAMPVDGKPDSGKLFFATIDRRRFAATVSLPTALVKGTIQAKVAKEPRSFLTIEAGPFFPVTGAKVFHCAAAESLECPVVIVNKLQVATLAFAL